MKAAHNHELCIEDAVAAAERVCEERGVKLTDLRRKVLELVWAGHKPVGAYDILASLEQEEGRRPAPPTVYRALDFLLENGLIHRIETMNAFVGCDQPEHRHGGQFLICENCGEVTELDDLSTRQSLKKSAEKQGFQIQRQSVELVGLCATCRTEGENA